MEQVYKKMNIRQKDLVILPYPYTNHSRTKVRPAIIVSNDNINKTEDCIVAPLTTVIKESPYSIVISQEDMASGELVIPSRVRADKIVTIKKIMIHKVIGRIKEKTFEKIREELIKVF